MNYVDILPRNGIGDSVECERSLNRCVRRNGSPDGSRDLVFHESGKFLISGERESAPLRAGYGYALFNEGSGSMVCDPSVGLI